MTQPANPQIVEFWNKFKGSEFISGAWDSTPWEHLPLVGQLEFAKLFTAAQLEAAKPPESELLKALQYAIAEIDGWYELAKTGLRTSYSKSEVVVTVGQFGRLSTLKKLASGLSQTLGPDETQRLRGEVDRITQDRDAKQQQLLDALGHKQFLLDSMLDIEEKSRRGGQSYEPAINALAVTAIETAGR